MTTETVSGLPALDQATIDYAIRFHGHRVRWAGHRHQAARLALREVGGAGARRRDRRRGGDGEVRCRRHPGP